MILINIYGKLEPVIISQKLGLGLCNPARDWVKSFPDDEFEEEYILHVHQVKKNKKCGFNVAEFENRHDYDKLVEALGWKEKNKDSKLILAEHLVEINVINFEDSLLTKKNTTLDSPTCEMQYPYRFMKFCSRLGANTSSGLFIPCVTYDSDDFFTKYQIIKNIESQSKCKDFKLDTRFLKSIENLKFIGQKLDVFLVDDKDFWLFDYIVNALSDEQEYENAYRIFKTMSLIEMLIINPLNNGRTFGDMESKLPKFLPDYIDSGKKTLYANYLRKIRNKIAHGDFESFSSLLERYRNEFMKNFQYDEFEHSIDNWTLGNITTYIDIALNNILYYMFTDKSGWENLRNN